MSSEVVVFLKVQHLRDTLTSELKALDLLVGVSDFWTHVRKSLLWSLE